MPPKALVTTPLMVATTLKSGSSGDTSIANTNLQLVITGQLQEIVNQLTTNNRLLKERVNKMGAVKIKLPSIKRFVGEKLKLKEFLIQIYFKITQEEAKLFILVDQVVYIGLFLIERALKQFKPYLIEIQLNSIITTNLEVKYLFSSQGGFMERLIQIFRDLKVITIVKRKL